MDDKLNAGRHAFMIESNRIIREVVIIKVVYDLLTVQFIDTKGAVRVRRNRLYETEQEAKMHVTDKRKTGYKSPYEYDL